MDIFTSIFSFTNEMVLTDEHEQIGDIEFEGVIYEIGFNTYIQHLD